MKNQPMTNTQAVLLIALMCSAMWSIVQHPQLIHASYTGQPQPILSGVTGSISGGVTLGTCDSGTASVTGATTAMTAVASPVTNPGTGIVWGAFVSAADTVTVVECGLAIVTPTATTYQVRVFK